MMRDHFELKSIIRIALIFQFSHDSISLSFVAEIKFHCCFIFYIVVVKFR